MKTAGRAPAVVLVGAGHVHMAVLAQAKRLRQAGLDLTLVDPGSFWYGAQPADVICGRLRADRLRVALGRLCSGRGIRYCSERAIGVDTRHRRLWLASGARLDYDRLSLNVGTECDDSGFETHSTGGRAWRANVVQELAQLHEILVRDCSHGVQPCVAVVGGGRRAAEITAGLSMAVFAERCRLAWYLPGERVLDNAPAGASRRVARLLGRRNVHVVSATPILGMVDKYLYTRDGRRFGVDHVVLTGRERCARLIRTSGLPTAAFGLQVTQRLQSPRDARVFAAGGCANQPQRRRLVGVDVMRQARVLADNLLASLSNRPLTSYWPAADAASLDLADGRAVGWYGRWWWHNRCTARLRARRDARLRERLLKKTVVDSAS